METQNPSLRPQILSLSQGGQAVINGAIITASEPCTIEVGSGAFVLSGRSLWRDRDPLHNPREELYFSMLDASTDPARFAEERFRFFTLLSQIVAQERTHEAQEECALCASVLLSGDAEAATRSAARMASERFGKPKRHANVPGQRGERRQTEIIRPLFAER
jgi:flagellar biosynthesis regulator FlbT